MATPEVPQHWILRDKFNEVYPHHDSISALWNLEWKAACKRSTYPFHEGRFDDFEPIIQALIEKGIHDGYSVEFTSEFLPAARRLATEGDAAAAEGDRCKAIELYLRSSTVYRLARFPYINGPLKREAYEEQKKTYMKAAAYFEPPIRDVTIPFTAATAQDEADSIPLYVRIPPEASKSDPCPAVILMCGLDGHRPDFTAQLNALVSRGWATITVDIPGTADCPAERRDPKSADRLWTSVLDWMQGEGVYDMRKVLCWGLSTGGYYGIRAAHTHASRFAGAVGQGAGTHFFYSRPWLEKARYHEYPWDMLPAMMEKFGYESAEDFMDKALDELSLVKTGIVDMPSCRLLLVNGTLDGLMPIEDSSLMMEYGSPKEARFFPELTHMGNPMALGYIYSWMESVVGKWKPGHLGEG